MQHLTKKVTIRLATCLRLRILALGMLGALSFSCHIAMAQCTSILTDGNFEEQSRNFGDGKLRDGLYPPWHAEGRAAIDPKRGLSYRGDNNAWAGKKTGWNGIYHNPTRLSAGVLYTLTAFVHTSGDVRDGYFGFRNKDQRPVSEIKFGPLPAYKELTVKFIPSQTGLYHVFTGFWAPNPEAWIRVDLVRLESACQDVNANPGDQ
jgi:hypothetical protein